MIMQSWVKDLIIAMVGLTVICLTISQCQNSGSTAQATSAITVSGHTTQAADPTDERVKQATFAKADVDQAIKDLGGRNEDAAQIFKRVSDGIQTDITNRAFPGNVPGFQASLRDGLAIVNTNVHDNTTRAHVQQDIGKALITLGYVIQGPTPKTSIDRAADYIEQAHEGIGNRIHNDCDVNTGSSADIQRCKTSFYDFQQKIRDADNLLHYDIMNQNTYGSNGTVEHVFGNALYWAGESVRCFCNNDEDGHNRGSLNHAEDQVGILRDVLNAQR